MFAFNSELRSSHVSFKVAIEIGLDCCITDGGFLDVFDLPLRKALLLKRSYSCISRGSCISCCCGVVCCAINWGGGICCRRSCVSSWGIRVLVSNVLMISLGSICSVINMVRGIMAFVIPDWLLMMVMMCMLLFKMLFVAMMVLVSICACKQCHNYGKT